MELITDIFYVMFSTHSTSTDSMTSYTSYLCTKIHYRCVVLKLILDPSTPSIEKKKKKGREPDSCTTIRQ